MSSEMLKNLDLTQIPARAQSIPTLQTTSSMQTATTMMLLEVKEGDYKGDWGGEETESGGVRQTHISSLISDSLNVAW